MFYPTFLLPFLLPFFFFLNLFLDSPALAQQHETAQTKSTESRNTPTDTTTKPQDNTLSDPSDLNTMYLQLKDTADRIQNLQKVLSTPLMKSILHILSDQKLITPLLQRVETLNFKRLAAYQLILFIAYLLFKSWFTSKKMHWFKKIFGSLAFTLSYLIIAAYAVPLLFLGHPFHRIVSKIILALINTP